MLNSNEPRNMQPEAGDTQDISPKLREIFRKKRRLALAKQRHSKRCSPLVLVRVLHRRPDIVKPLD